MSDEPLRPDPDRLLQHTAAPHRGKLKVFFGACAGVGKHGRCWRKRSGCAPRAGYSDWRGGDPRP